MIANMVRQQMRESERHGMVTVRGEGRSCVQCGSLALVAEGESGLVRAWVRS